MRTTIRIKLSFLSLLIASTTGFSTHPSGYLTRTALGTVSSPRSKVLPIRSKKGDGYDEEEVQEMEELILSLSLEATDESRRERLTKIFGEELAKPNGAPKHFSDLFDQTLVIVGDRVKTEAQEYAEKLQENSKENTNADAEDESDKESATSQGFPQQKQLWALIDMMVQSKTIVKRASGELGSKGSFQ